MNDFPCSNRVFLPALVWIFVAAATSCSTHNPERVQVVRVDTRVVEADTPGTYSVHPGDTLFSIAWQNEVDMDDLAQWNGLKPPFLLSVGQVLRLSPPSVARKPDVNPPSQPVRTARDKRPARVASHASDDMAKPQSASRQDAASAKKPAPDHKKDVTKWIWPVKGKIIAGFSPKRGGNKGIDLLTPGPQPVRAAASGRVVYAGEGLRGYGKLVIVKHNRDYLSAYAYNSRLRVKEKQDVKAGEVIADTGWDGLYANQLHFEVRFRGKPIDPMKFLKR